MGQCATHTFIITQSDIPKTRMTNSPRDINEKSDNTGISDISELMGGYIDGQLSAEEKLRAETALQTDVTAAKVLAELQSLRTGIKALGGETEQRSSMAEKILAQLNAPKSRHRLLKSILGLRSQPSLPEAVDSLSTSRSWPLS